MKITTGKINLIAVLGILMFGCIIAGCPGHRYLQGGEFTQEFIIENAEFEGAFSKAMKTADEIGFLVSRYEKSRGFFHARRGAGFAEVTEMDILIEPLSPGKL